MTYDALIIGAGHNGLVAANTLADRGWSVVVLEAQDEPGGAVRSGEVTRPGFVSDLYSAFYPLGYASPVLRALELESHGLRWLRSEVAVAHPASDGRCAIISTRLEETMASLDAFAPGDGEAWRELYAYYQRIGPAFLDVLLSGPLPPLRPALRLLRQLGSVDEVLRFARFGILPIRRLAEETFDGEGGAWILSGNALHADLTPEAAGGGLFGWLLCSLGQHVGFPVPEGGAGNLTRALVRRLESRGGEVRCGHPVSAIEVAEGRAQAVRVVGGERLRATRAVIADVNAPTLYDGLLPRGGGETVDLKRFQPDSPTVKVDWALDRPIPWLHPDVRRAGTVHVSEGMDGLSIASTEIARGKVPDEPFVIVGQYSMVDPSRMPAGKESAWGYTHVPDGTNWKPGELDRFVERMEAQVERMAPGFRDSILDRHVLDLPAGVVNLGTAQIHQQLVFRPTPGLGRPETPVAGLYLGSAAAHPGGGVHGAGGHNAALAALAQDRLPGRLRDRVARR